MVARHSHREITAPHRLKRVKQFLRRVALSVRVWFDFGASPGRWGGGIEITHGVPSCSKFVARPRTRASRFFFAHKIVQTIPNQAKCLSYYSWLGSGNSGKENNSERGTFVPEGLKYFLGEKNMRDHSA
jgi:hypothetical protein